MQDTLLHLLDTYKKEKTPIGIDCMEYGHISPIAEGIFDNYCAKR